MRASNAKTYHGEDIADLITVRTYTHGSYDLPSGESGGPSGGAIVVHRRTTGNKLSGERLASVPVGRDAIGARSAAVVAALRAIGRVESADRIEATYGVSTHPTARGAWAEAFQREDAGHFDAAGGAR